MILSEGGWAAVKELKRSAIHLKSDERILGDRDFVSVVLLAGDESFERRTALKAGAPDLDYVAKKSGGPVEHRRG